MNNAWNDLHPKVRRGLLIAKTYDANGRDISDKVDVSPKKNANQARALEAIDVLSSHEAENGGFVFTLFSQARTVVERFPTLTAQDMARMVFIGTYTSWDDGKLTHDNGRAITKDGLHRLTKMSRNRFNEFYGRLTDEGVIRTLDEGSILVSPAVFYRGSFGEYKYSMEGVQYTRLFRKTIRDLYEAYNGRSLGQLAIIYEVIPFVNFRTNIIAFNPEEGFADDVRPMPLEKLAVLLGYANAQKLKVALNRVKVEGHPVFGFFENPNDRRSFRIVVNPRVIFAAGAEELTAIKALFN